MNSVTDKLVWIDVCQPHPIRQRVGTTLNANDAICAGVIGLLYFRRPSAIPRFVMTISVDPIERVQDGRPRAHVGQERRKVPPPFAHTNPAPAIPMKISVIVVIAPIEHMPPRPVFRSRPTPMLELGISRTMPGCFSTHRSSCLFLQTSAGPGTPTSQLRGMDDCDLSAVALTLPAIALCATLCDTNDQKPGKPLSSEINKGWQWKCSFDGYEFTAAGTDGLYFCLRVRRIMAERVSPSDSASRSMASTSEPPTFTVTITSFFSLDVLRLVRMSTLYYNVPHCVKCNVIQNSN